MVRNPHWYLPQKNTPNRVILRRSPRGSSRDTILLDDSWPNVATSSSMMPTEVREEYRKMGFQFWERPADRVFLLKLGPRINDRSGRRLARFLNQKLRHKKLLGGLAGTVPTEQIFPLGYHLYDPGFDLSKDQKTELPVDFRKKPISLLATDRRVSKKLLESAVEAIESVTGVRPVVKKTTLSNLIREFAAATYDLYFGPIGLADPDPNGVLSFYLEGEQPIIMSNPKAGFDYLKILDKIRTDQDEASRLQKMRKLVTQTIQDGSVVPLFHFSSLGIARPEIDLSDIPTSDESLTFSRILISKEGRSRLSE